VTRCPIPQTELVDCLYIAYKSRRRSPGSNPPTEVGGLFIISLQSRCRTPGPNPNNVRWWGIQASSISCFCRSGMNDPPAPLVGFAGSVCST
jgi:hypothetical protein